MKTAYTATQLAIIRTHPQISQYGLAVHVPQIISEGVLNAVPTIYPGNSLSITNIVAGYTLSKIKRGMTLWLGHEGPRYDLGQLRVRKDYSGNSLIEVAEYGSGLMNYLNGASVTIVEDYRIWPIHPSYDTTASRWRVDLDPYTAQTKSYGPQVIMGPPAVIRFGNNETKVLASYVGDLSLQHSGSITSQTWTFPDGQTVTSALGSSQNPIVITYLNASPDGAVHTLKVTDSNGNSHIGQRLTFAFGSNIPNFPVDCKFDVISGGYKQGGYKTRINLGENAPSSTFPDGAKVVLFENASYGSYGSSIGGNYFARDNIVMVGRVVTESQRIEPFTNDLTFEIESEDGELHRSQSYDMFLESGSAASDWSMASGLTVDRAGIVLAKYRSTIANVIDFHPASGIASTGEIPYRDLAAGTLYDQLTYNYQAVGFGVISFDLQGNLWAMLDTQVTGTSSTLPTIMDIGAGDRRDAVQIDHEHRDTNAQYLLYAVESSDYNPIAAWSPGDRQGYFGQRQEISRNLLANSQDTVITWAGNKRAQDNNPYKKVVIPLAGNNRIDPVPQSLITMSLSSNKVPRGYTWNNKNLIPYEISIAYNPDSRYPMIDLTAEAVVNGIGGSAFTYPTVISIISPPPPLRQRGAPPDTTQTLALGYA